MKSDCKFPISVTGRRDGQEPDPSRRDFFQPAVRGATAVSAGALSAMTMSGPVQAQYGGGPYVWKSNFRRRRADLTLTAAPGAWNPNLSKVNRCALNVAATKAFL
jgi:hypothetical protein